MIRIMTATKPRTTTVTVDGELTGEYLEAIGACVKQAIGKGRPVRLFLRDVSRIDGVGRGFLARLAADGVHLRANGVYSSYVVAEISRSAAAGKGRFGPGKPAPTADAPAVGRQTLSPSRRRSTESTICGGDADALEDSGMRIRKCG